MKYMDKLYEYYIEYIIRYIFIYIQLHNIVFKIPNILN